jgi:hypothetical protein
MNEAITAGVLRADGQELAFRHPLIRAALYDELPATVHAAWHRDAARALADDGATAEQVARQLLPALDAESGAIPVDGWVVRWLAGTAHHLVGQAPHAAVPLLRWAVGGREDLRRLPLVTIGKCGGAITSGQVVQFPVAEKTMATTVNRPAADLYLTIARAMGAANVTFPGQTGVLPGVLT